MLRSCSYENEVTDALKAGHWPEGCAPELRTHVETCARCGDLALLTQTFQRAKIESVHGALPAAPGLLWWKAQLRRKNAATERVNRPITIAQTFAWMVTSLVGVVLIASQYNHGVRWASWWAGLEFAKLLHFSPGSALNGNLLLIIPGLGILALLSGIAVYVASEKS